MLTHRNDVQPRKKKSRWPWVIAAILLLSVLWINYRNQPPYGPDIWICFQDYPSQVQHWQPIDQTGTLLTNTRYCGFGHVPNKTAWPDTHGYPPTNPTPN